MEKQWRDSRRILVIDDDEVIRELLGALLTVQGFEVNSVSSGADALSILGSPDSPSMVLTDLQMPGLEGQTLTHALRAAGAPGTILIGMSGRQPKADVLEPLDGFLLKPFDSRTLASTFAAAMELRTRAEQQVLGAPSETATDDPGYPVLDEGIYSALGMSFQPPQLHDFYAMTLRDVHTRFDRMKSLAEGGDLDALRREAHAIKGGCGMVGARELQHLAHSLELGTSLDPDTLHKIPMACDRLQRMLDEKLPQKW